MSTTLSKGYVKPSNGDRGSTFFPDLEGNIDRVNGHKHDGTDGEKLNIKDLVKQSQTLSSGDWGSDLGGSTYTRSVTMPTNVLFDDVILKFKTSAGDVIHPTVTKTGASAYDISVNDNSITVLVTYV